jgi:hypothetical protein
MALKAVVSAEEYSELPEHHQSEYKQAQGGTSWILDVEGVDNHPLVKGLSTTLGKFKELGPDAKALRARLDAAAEAQTALDEMKGLWGELDAEETKAALDRLAELESEGGKVDIEARIEAAKGVLERKHAKILEGIQANVDGLTAANLEKDDFIRDLIIEQELDSGLTHIKAIPELREGAKALIHKRYRPKVERVENELTGKPEYRGIINTDVGESTIADFFERWQTEDEASPYLPASGNTGTGSRTQEGAGTRGRKNPWSKENWNLTEQGRIVKENRALAKTLASAAGHKLTLSE